MKLLLAPYLPRLLASKAGPTLASFSYHYAVDGADLLWMCASGLGTGLGGALVLFWRNPSERSLDGATGFAAGVMLAALSLGLLAAALDQGPLWQVVLGLIVGGALLALFDHFLPHIHQRFREEEHQGDIKRHSRSWLVMAAMTLHNIPEGMAVGIAFAAGGAEFGIPLAIAIMLHNIPEGFAVAAPLCSTGRSPRRIAAMATATGLVEIPAAILAFLFFSSISSLMVFGLAFAAGAMLYVTVDELIPAAIQRGHERTATLCCIAGFVLLMTLNQIVANFYN